MDGPIAQVEDQAAASLCILVLSRSQYFFNDLCAGSGDDPVLLVCTYLIDRQVKRIRQVDIMEMLQPDGKHFVLIDRFSFKIETEETVRCLVVFHCQPL